MAGAARQRIDGQHPLSTDVILLQVLAYVGCGEWAFVAEVCTLWRDSYQPIGRRNAAGEAAAVTRAATLYTAAFASPSRAAFAARELCGSRLSSDFHFAAGRHASITCLEAAEQNGLEYSADLCRSAAHAGALDILRWLSNERGVALPDEMDEYAAMSGNTNLLTWLQQRGVVFTARSCAEAARCGHLDALKLLRAANCSWNSDTVEAAARGSHKDLLEWAWHEECPRDRDLVAEAAAASGDLDTLSWVLARAGGPFGDSLMIAAASVGHVDTMRYLQTLNPADLEEHAASAEVLLAAIEGGHLAAVRWVEHFDPECSLIEQCEAAARGSSVPIVQHVLTKVQDRAYELRVSWADALQRMLNIAGCCGREAIATYLRQHYAEWPEDLSIVTEGYLVRWTPEMVSWARRNGCTAL
jgi:hypothetical protein